MVPNGDEPLTPPPTTVAAWSCEKRVIPICVSPEVATNLFSRPGENPVV
jgi:hypothetical protein